MNFSQINARKQWRKKSNGQHKAKMRDFMTIAKTAEGIYENYIYGTLLQKQASNTALFQKPDHGFKYYNTNKKQNIQDRTVGYHIHIGSQIYYMELHFQTGTK